MFFCLRAEDHYNLKRHEMRPIISWMGAKHSPCEHMCTKMMKNVKFYEIFTSSKTSTNVKNKTIHAQKWPNTASNCHHGSLICTKNANLLKNKNYIKFPKFQKTSINCKFESTNAQTQSNTTFWCASYAILWGSNFHKFVQLATFPPKYLFA